MRNQFGPVIHEMEHREMLHSKLEVIPAPRAGRVPAFGVEGSVTVVLARAGSGGLKEFRSAIGSGGDRLKQFHAKLVKQYEAGKNIPTEELARAMVKSPVLADVRYGGRTLNSGIFLPHGIDYAVAIFPYNGGRLAEGSFELVEYVQGGTQERLEGVVLSAAPELTAAEEAALNKLTPAQLAGNIGASLDCDTTWWAVAVVVAVLVTAAALQAAGAAGVVAVAGITAINLGQAAHLSEEQITKLGPAASARELLAMRRSALMQAKVG